MKKIAFMIIATGTLVFAAHDFHAHTAHSCPKNPHAHACHKPPKQDKETRFQDAAPDGQDYSGCTCIYDCWGPPTRLVTFGNLKAYLTTRF